MRACSGAPGHSSMASLSIRWPTFSRRSITPCTVTAGRSCPAGFGIGSGHGYDDGGWLTGGLVSKKTRRPEAVLNPGQSAAFLALAQAASQGGGTGLGDTSGIEMRLERLIRAVETQAGRTGGAMADALNGAARKAAYKSAYSARG